MIEAFGLENLAIKITAPDGTVFKQTENWLDEAEFIEQERALKAKWAKNNEAKIKQQYKNK